MKKKKDFYNSLNVKKITDNKLFWKIKKSVFLIKL